MRKLLIITSCLLVAAGSLMAQKPVPKIAISIGPSDIKDYKGLAVKLRAPNEPVSAYIAGRLSQGTMQLLMKSEAATEPSEQLRATLLHDLNSLLKDQKLYSADRFKAFKLPDTLLAESAKPRFKGTTALAKFNKQLIEIAYSAEFNRAPKPAEPAKVEPPKPVVEDTAYAAANFKIGKGLAQRLLKPQDKLTDYIKGTLTKTTKDSLKKYDGIADPSPALTAALAADLNKILADPKFYDEKRFKDVALSDKARKRLEGAKDLRGAELARLNKALLDEAYTTGLPPVKTAGKGKLTAPDTAQIRDLKPASSLSTTGIWGGDLTVGNLMLSAPDTIFSTHLWVEGMLNQKKIWRDSADIGDTASGIIVDAKAHWDRNWEGPSWANYQIVNLHFATGQAKIRRGVVDTTAVPYTFNMRDTTDASRNIDWGLTIGAKKYLGNSPFFGFAENQDSQALQKSQADSDRQVDVFISAGTGYGQVIDLANYVRAKKFEQAMLKEGIIAKPLTRPVMGELIKILQLRKTSQDRIILVNKMLTERGLVVKTTYSYDTIFLLSEILDQSTDQLETGLEFRAYYRQQVLAQLASTRKYMYGFGIGEVKYAKPITLSLAWVSQAHYWGLLHHKDKLWSGLQLNEYGAETGLRYNMALSELKASVSALKPFLKGFLKYGLHAQYAYKILNKIELVANYDYTLEKNEYLDYEYSVAPFAITGVTYKSHGDIKRSEVNLRLKYYFF